MLRSRLILAWALAAILGLGGAPAQARRAVQRPAPAAPATPDDAFVQARQAALQNDLAPTLADTVLAEFKTRLGRIGIEYQTPAMPG